MALLLHILPEDGLGGAEIAARHAARAAPDRLTVLTLAGRPSLGGPTSLKAVHPLSPLAAWRAAGRARDYRVAVFSLWKSVLAMAACAVRAPGTRRVLFLHSDRRVHLLDTLATWLAARLADEIWADSRRSLEGLGPQRPRNAVERVISFRLERMVGRSRTQPSPRLIFWGRLNPLKRVDRAIGLFAAIARDRPDARLTVIGPDAGSEARLREQVRSLGLDEQVAFTGPLDVSAIADRAESHDIFLHLSDQEGAAMALIEAMQLGLVPVVTPVGEMASYVRHKETGIVYRSHDQALAALEELLGDPSLFARLSAAAIDAWSGQGLYADEVIAAGETLANRGNAPCAG